MLQESDSEEEDIKLSSEKTTYDSAEENKENLFAGKNGNIRKIYKTLGNSEESDLEESSDKENLETQVTSCLDLGLQSENMVDFTVDRKNSKNSTPYKEGTEGKAKIKSKRRLEKEEKKMEKIRRLKKKETKSEVCLKK